MPFFNDSFVNIIVSSLVCKGSPESVRAKSENIKLYSILLNAPTIRSFLVYSYHDGNFVFFRHKLIFQAWPHLSHLQYRVFDMVNVFTSSLPHLGHFIASTPSFIIIINCGTLGFKLQIIFLCFSPCL
jgi:hypothetical protein